MEQVHKSTTGRGEGGEGGGGEQERGKEEGVERSETDSYVHIYVSLN